MVLLIPINVHGLANHDSDNELFINFKLEESASVDARLGYEGFQHVLIKDDDSGDVLSTISFTDKNNNPVLVDNIGVNNNMDYIAIISKTNVPEDGVYVSIDNNKYTVIGKKEGITKNATLVVAKQEYINNNKLTDYIDGDIVYLVWNCSNNICYSDEIYTKPTGNTYINQYNIRSGNNGNPSIGISTLADGNSPQWFTLSYLDISVKTAAFGTKGLFNRHLLGEDCRVTWEMFLEALEGNYSSFNFVNNSGGFEQPQTEREIKEVKNAIITNSANLDEEHAIVPNVTGRYVLYIHDDEYPVPAPPVPPTEPDPDDTTSTNTSTTKTTTTTTTVVAEDTTEVRKEKNAKTGDNVLVYFLIQIISVFGIIIFSKSKRLA